MTNNCFYLFEVLDDLAPITNSFQMFLTSQHVSSYNKLFVKRCDLTIIVFHRLLIIIIPSSCTRRRHVHVQYKIKGHKHYSVVQILRVPVRLVRTADRVQSAPVHTHVNAPRASGDQLVKVG